MAQRLLLAVKTVTDAGRKNEGRLHRKRRFGIAHRGCSGDRRPERYPQLLRRSARPAQAAGVLLLQRRRGGDRGGRGISHRIAAGTSILRRMLPKLLGVRPRLMCSPVAVAYPPPSAY